MGSSDPVSDEVVTHVEFDSSSRPVAEHVVEAVAAYRGTEPGELAPLYGVVSPDGLNAVIDGAGTGADSTVSVTFEYEGLRVGVHGEGVIQLAELPGSGSPP